MNEELKPCPFCGSEDVVDGSSRHSLGVDIYVKCTNCNAKVQICEEYGQDELYKRWNRRVADER